MVRCSGSGGRQSVLNRTTLLHATCHHRSVKHKKSKKQRDKATLASVTKEMAGPRFAKSTRKKEEEADHGVMRHDNFTYSVRYGS
jgi:hypothetical protein